MWIDVSSNSEAKVKGQEAWNSNKLQVLVANCLRSQFKTGGFLKDCASYCSNDTAEDNKLSLGSEVKRLHSLVISLFLCAYGAWTLTAELKKRAQVLE